jgi:2-polyprenyl-6-hydroxyphenyl methylase/3-demethylubiquinone-9 3-methyltransferase
VLDAGCGNGNLAARIAAAGFEVAAFDPSVSAIEHARAAYPGVQFEVASGYEDIHARFGRLFDACIAVEVIEHLYEPRQFVSRVFDVLRPGGRFVLSTPYHGYLKNLALAVTGKMDSHYTALWDGGHIKFWSRATLTAVLQERGFQILDFQGAGRLPLLWKSMIVTARKPPNA